jgi:hypothetical protein
MLSCYGFDSPRLWKAEAFRHPVNIAMPKIFNC